MRPVAEGSLRFRFLVVAGAVLVMTLGAIQLRQMPVDVLPEFAPPYVEVQTESLGLSADEIESLVTLNLEELLNGTPWLKSIHSTSVPGLSSIVLTFEPGTDVIKARQLVAERLSLAYALPNVSSPPVILQPLSATSRTMMVALSSASVPAVDIGVLAHWTIRPALLAVPGVSNVSVWGQRDRQLQVLVDPATLLAHDVTLDQVVEAAGDAVWVSPLSFLNASTPGSGGWIDTPQQRLEVRHDLPISKAEDLARVPVSGTNFLIGDVATVVEDHQPLIGDAVVDGGAGFLVVIEKFPGANTLEVTRGVEEALENLKPGLQGIDIETGIFRPASFIEQALGNLGWLALIVMILALVTLVALVRDWRVALMVLVVVPLALVAASLVLFAMGSTMNTMVLAGLVVALGLVLDDVIVDIDNVARRLRMRSATDDADSLAGIVVGALGEMRGSLFYAMLVMLVAITPVFVVEGVTGSLLAPMALAYALALIASLLVAVIVTPALGLILLERSPLSSRPAPLFQRLDGTYAAILARSLRMLRPVAIIAAGMVLLGGLSLPFLGRTFLPSFRDSDLLVDWHTVSATSHPEMVRLASRATAQLQQVEGVGKVGAEIGRAVLGDQVVGMNSGRLWVNIDAGADYDQTRQAVERAIGGYAGVASNVNTYLDDRIRQVVTGSSADLVVRLYGIDWDVMRAKAREIEQALKGVPGVTSAQAEQQETEPFLQVEVDLARAENYGIKPGDVRRAAATYLAGIGVGTLFEEQKVFTVVVWGKPEVRDSLTSMRDLLIDTPAGGHVRLGEVATVSLGSSLTAIERDTVSRRVDISLAVEGRDMGAVVADVKARLAGISVPLEYHTEVLGEYADRQAAETRLAGFALAALLGIFLLLQAAFGSWRLAGVLLVTLPVALVGGVLACLVSGTALSIGSLVGFVTVLGIAARNGIMLINRYRHLERTEGEAVGADLVLHGARERLFPMLTTAAVLAIVMVPLIVAGERAGLELIRPAAIVIVGGLVTSTLSSLFLVPVLYLHVKPGLGDTTAQELAGGT